VIATHVEVVRQHDGTITPVPYFPAAVISVFAAGLLVAYQLRKRWSAGLARQPAPAARVDHGLPRTAPGTARMATLADAAQEVGLSLLVLSGPGPHRQIPVPPGGLVLGRESDLGPPFTTDDSVSHVHASVRPYNSESAEVTDLGSTNGTYINGRRIVGPAWLSGSDVLRVGQIELRVSPARPGETQPEKTRAVGQAGTTGEDRILQAARAAFRRKDFHASAAEFGKLISSPAHAADARYGLGMTALAQGRTQDAEKFFNACLHADRTYANAWYQLGLLNEARSPEEARGYYREALRHNPQHAGAIRKLPGEHVTAGTRPPSSAPPPAYASALPAEARGPEPAGDGPDQFPPAPSGHIQGHVAGFQRRAEQSFFLHRLYLYVWDFRIVRPGVPPVMVEMRGFRFRGDISNGDVVDIAVSGARAGEVLKVRRLLNLTTNAEIRTSYGRSSRTLAAALKIILALAVLAAFITFAAFFIHHVAGK
jgi:tetratricopeptide (TPR) repeat protein